MDYFPDAFVVLASLIEPEVTSDLCNTLLEKDFNIRYSLKRKVRYDFFSMQISFSAYAGKSEGPDGFL